MAVYSNIDLQISILGEAVDNEINQFSKLTESINILNENGLLLEKVDLKETWEKFKEKIKEIWEKFKAFVKKIIDFIKDKINSFKLKFSKNKIEQEEKEIEELLENVPDDQKEEKNEKFKEKISALEYNDAAILYFDIKNSKLLKDYDLFKNKNLILYNINVKMNSDDVNISTDVSRSHLDEIQKQNEDTFKKINIDELLNLKSVYGPEKDSITLSDKNDDKVIEMSNKVNKYIDFKYIKIDDYWASTSPHQVFHKILDVTPDDYIFGHDLPFGDILKEYESTYNKLVNNKIHLDKPELFTYYMTGFKQDITNLRKIVNAINNIYSVSFSFIGYNWRLLYKIADVYKLVFANKETKEKLNKIERYNN